MDQKERLAICSNCINRKLDFEHGFVCQLTGRFAEFEGTCKHYVKDHTVTDTIKVRTKDRPFVPLFDTPPPKQEPQVRKKATPRKAAPRKATTRKAAPGKAAPKQTLPKKTSRKKQASQVALKKLRRYQSFIYALIGGLLITATAAAGWAFVTAKTGYQGVYLALGVGLLVGIAVRFFGAGIKWIFGFLAALLALAGSLLGYYLSQNGFLEELQLASIMGIPDYLDQELMLNTMRDSFVPLDLLFYVLAALLAYFLAIRRINSRKMARLEHDGYKGAPALYWLRLPLILAGILLPAYYGYTLTNNSSIELQTIYYDSGAKMSEGDMYDDLEIGQWTSWHENGNIQSIGNYAEGRKDSLWQWYDEAGILTGSGMYSEDVEHGPWVNYFPDGVLSDSGSYMEGLKEGLWKYFHENGSLKYDVHYKAGKMNGEKILLSPSGTVVNVAFFENGVPVENGK
jgi:antitoxin component YwqK of YwqJK toxin-antitoxin module